MRSAGRVGMIAVAMAAAASAAHARTAMSDGDWWTIDRDLADTRFSPLADVNRSNVSRLAVAWSYPMRGYNTAVPLVIGSVMYFPAGNRVIALDAVTGKEIWTYAVDRPSERPGNGVSGRGVAYWPGDGTTPARILVMATKRMIALDAKSGKPVTSFGDGGYLDVGVGYGGTVTISGDVGVIGAATLELPVGDAGNPRAFDVRTGKKLWEFQTVPLPGQPYHDTWGDGWKGRSGTNMWGFAAPVDEKRGIVYIPLGSASPNYWGGSRPGSNVFSDSLLALDLKTGQVSVAFPDGAPRYLGFGHADRGSADRSDGRRQEASDHRQREQDQLVLRIRSSDRQAGVRRGRAARAQGRRPRRILLADAADPGHPTPPLSRVAMTKDDIVTAADTTPEHAAACQAMWQKAGGFVNMGPFTPFGYHEDGAPPRSFLQLPGGIGGVNWGGPAADPRTGWVYVNAHDTSLVGWTEKKDPKVTYSFEAVGSDQPYDRASIDGKGPFFSFSAPIGGQYDAKGKGIGPSAPCYKGPWARLTAIDANTGEIKWAVPLGLVEGLPEGKQLQGDTGSAGPTVTAGGLVFVGATNDKRFRAFDATSGQQLWEAKLAGSANANPMSYRGSDGKQYVAINAGGTMMAFSLPAPGR